MDSFLIALNAVVPMFLFMCFGILIRQFGIASETFLKELNSVIFKAFFPILTFYNVYQADIVGSANIKMAGFCVIFLVLAFVVFIFAVPKIIKGNPQRGVFVQACFRGNFLLFGLALAGAVYGMENLGVISITLAIIVPVFNVLAVVTLETFRGGHVKIKSMIIEICKNPLIIGVIAGFVYNLLPIKTPEFFTKTVKDLATMTTPLAILVLGGTLKFSSIGKNLKYLIPGIFIKLVIMPISAVGIGLFIGFRGIDLFTVLAVFGSPVATASYAMSQTMGGDYDLAGQFVAISTVFSLFTMFIFIFSLSAFSLI